MATPVARLAVKVSPKASRNAILGWLGEALKLSVTAAPERGKANEAVEELLAEALNLAKRRVSVVSGHTQSRKLVQVEGLSDAELRARLNLRN
jgi:hypothetical protein